MQQGMVAFFIIPPSPKDARLDHSKRTFCAYTETARQYLDSAV